MSRLEASSRMWAAQAAQSDGQKRRRGRQPRPCTLSAGVRVAAAQFAASVGAPRVVEPAGFRDFVGWLQRLQGAGASDAWARLLGALLADTAGDTSAVQRMQPEVVREIIANVVVIRAGESSKLISTNARRQSARPEHGVTLMKIFDRALSRAARNHTAPAAPRAQSSAHTPAHYAHHAAQAARSHAHKHRSVAAPRPPMATPLRRSTPHTMRLPSMQELDESLRRRWVASRGDCWGE